MKRTLLASTLMALLSIGAPPVAAQELGEAKTYTQEWEGMGVGALIGVIAGGPPGLIIGLAGGGLIGRHQGLESDLESTQQQLKILADLQWKAESNLKKSRLEITDLHQKLAQDKAAKITRTEALIIAKEQHEMQLKAIVQGFILNIQFRTESADLEHHFQQQLDRAVTTLQAFPELAIHVDAYADQRGTTAFNKNLTLQRANVVVRHLQAARIATSRIRELSLGESRAEYAIHDVEGMDFDRRVLLYFCRR